MRGFSFRDRHGVFSEEEHRHFIEKDLNKFFVVGQKGKYYFEQEKSEVFYSPTINDESELLSEIKFLTKVIVGIIDQKQRGKYGGIDGKLNIDISKIAKEASNNDLIRIRHFLLALGHNIGGKWSGKASSPLVSVTHGTGCKRIARNFATNTRMGVSNGKGLILLGYTTTANLKKYTVFTEQLNMKLKNLGVTWYPDKHRELMIMDGILPTHILGLFEVDSENDQENFILNPWLNKMFIENQNVSLQRGIDIDQINFEEYARDLNYNSYFFQTNSKRFYGELNGRSFLEVPDMRDGI